MGYMAALFAGGRVVTGSHHGDAFCKLSQFEQNGDISSGFLDPNTGRFVSDDIQFYVKKIILIRHAEAEDQNQDQDNNPSITQYGRLQCEKAANFLSRITSIHRYVACCCDCQRVRATALSLCGQVGLPVQFGERFCDPQPNETPYQFLERLKRVIESLPECSIIISHSDFVVNMAQLAIGTDITQCRQWKNKIPNCSITYVENHEPIWIGESPI